MTTIKRLRQNAGKTLAQMADVSGAHVSTIQRAEQTGRPDGGLLKVWLDETNASPIERLAAVADHLGVDVVGMSAILGGA